MDPTIENKPIKHPFDGKSVHNPKRFQQEYLEEREKSIQKNFP